MTLDAVIQVLSNKIMTLNSRMSDAYLAGDLETVSSIEAEIAETQATLDKLKSLS